MPGRIETTELPNGDLQILVVVDRTRARSQAILFALALLILQPLLTLPFFFLFGWPSQTLLIGLGFAIVTMAGVFLLIALAGTSQREMTFLAGKQGLEVLMTLSGDPVRRRFPRDRIRAIGTSHGLCVTTDEGTFPLLLTERQEDLARVAAMLNRAVGLAS